MRMQKPSDFKSHRKVKNVSKQRQEQEGKPKELLIFGVAKFVL